MKQNSFFLLEKFIEKIHKEKIPLISLRYKPFNTENAYNGDYDFFTSKQHINNILQIIFNLATNYNINFTIDRNKYTKTKITLFDECDKQIILEIWSSLEVRDSCKKTLRYIFWDDIKKYISISNNGESIFPIEIEALYYLSHLYTKNKNLNAPEIQTRLNHYKKSLLKENSNVLSLYNDLMDNKKVDIKKISSRANMMLVKLNILNDRKNYKMVIKEVKLKIKSELRKAKSDLLKLKRFSSVVGPDGVGKTTIIDSLSDGFKKKSRYYRFKKTFRGSIFYNTIYPILKASAKKRLDMKKIDKNQVDDLYGGLLFYIALLKYSIFIITNFFIRKYVFADRFFYEFLIRDMRFNDKDATLRQNWKSLLNRTPNIYWLIQLDAPVDIIQSRKNELSKKDIQTYREKNFMFYLNKPTIIYTYVNTANDIDSCTKILLKNSESLY